MGISYKKIGVNRKKSYAEFGRVVYVCVDPKLNRSTFLEVEMFLVNVWLNRIEKILSLRKFPYNCVNVGTWRLFVLTQLYILNV